MILYAMAHTYGGMSMPSPIEYVHKVKMPIDADTFQRAVSIARNETDSSRDSVCNDAGQHETGRVNA